MFLFVSLDFNYFEFHFCWLFFFAAIYFGVVLHFAIGLFKVSCETFVKWFELIKNLKKIKQQ
jgi:hypothetical protein